MQNIQYLSLVVLLEVILFTSIYNYLYMSLMGLDNIEFAITMLFKRNIILKLKLMFTQYDKRERKF